MIHGAPGIGKSDIIHQIAATNNLKVIDIRLSSCDPTDLNGLAWFKKDAAGNADKASYIPFDTFPTEGDALPVDASGNQMNGWIIFLDELPSAPHSVQAPAFKLILDRMVGQRKLHTNAFLVAAGNTEDDGAIVNAIPTPLQSRMINFMVTPNRVEWVKWALQNGLDYRISSFLDFKPDLFYKFDPNHDDLTFACPRTWMFASKLMSGQTITKSDVALLAGCISEGVARELVSFIQVFEKIPKFKDIMLNPDTAPCPVNDASTMFAVCGMLGSNADSTNLGSVIQYVERMPMEFQVIALRNILGRTPQLAQNKVIDSWMDRYSNELWQD